MGEKQYIVFDKYDLEKAIIDQALPNDVIDNLEKIEQVCKDGRSYRGEINAHYLVIDQTHPGYESVCKYANELSAGVAGSICKTITAGQILATMTELSIDELVGMRIDELAPLIHKKYPPVTVGEVAPQLIEDAGAEILKQYAEENTERMLSLRSKELNNQEEMLQKKLRKHYQDVAEFERHVADTMKDIHAPAGYESLARILCEVMHQAAIGKGAQRHADSNPFERQPTLGYARKYNSPVGLLCQIMKKLDEYDRLDGVARRRELIGVMVYVAMLIIFDQEMHNYPVKQLEGIKGILYPVAEDKE